MTLFAPVRVIGDFYLTKIGYFRLTLFGHFHPTRTVVRFYQNTMEGDFVENRLSIQMELGMQGVRVCDEYSGQFGLVLKETEIRELVECRQKALLDTGRVEFGGGILPKLIRAFCDSPYIDQETYAATLTELQEAFYYFKGEAQERFTDDELIEFMAAVFNGRAQGSSEYLICTSLEALCRYARGGFDEHDADGIGDLF